MMRKNAYWARVMATVLAVVLFFPQSVSAISAENSERNGIETESLGDAYNNDFVLDESDLKITMIPGEVRRLNLNKTGKYIYGVKWSLQDVEPKGCVSIKNGVVTANNLDDGITKGRAIITAEYMEHTVQYFITVDGSVPETVSIADGVDRYQIKATKDLDLSVGGTKKSVTVNIPEQLRDDNCLIRYSILNDGVIEVGTPRYDSGREKATFDIIPIDAGATYIMWALTDESGRITTDFTKVIVKKPVTALSVNVMESGLSLTVGEGRRLEVYGDKNNTDCNYPAFSVRGTGINVSGTGYVTATSPGCSGTVSVRCGQVKQTVSVTVLPDSSYGRYLTLNKTSVKTVIPSVGENPFSVSIGLSNPKTEQPAVKWSIVEKPKGITLSQLEQNSIEVMVNDLAKPGCYTITAAADGWNTAYCELIVGDVLLSNNNFFWSFSMDDENGMVRLEEYLGNNVDITVPASCSIDGNTYNTIYSDYVSLPENTRSITFEKGVKASGRLNFSNLSFLKAIDFADLDTSDVTDFRGMFEDCSSLETVDLSMLNGSKVESIGSMFYGCSSLKSIDFGNCFKSSMLTDMGDTFNGCESLKKLDFSNFSTNNVSIMWYLFIDCKNLAVIDLSGFDMSSIEEEGEIEGFFEGCTSITTIITPKKMGNVPLPLPGIFTDGEKNYSSIPAGLTGSIKLTLGSGGEEPIDDNWHEDWDCVLNDKAPYTITLEKYKGNSTDVVIPSKLTLNGKVYTVVLKGTNSSLNTSFPSATVSIVVSDGVQAPEDVSYLFYGLTNLKTLSVKGFDTSKTQNMAYMFAGCSSLSGLDLDGYVTKVAVDMSGMFSGCSSLNSLNLSSFNTFNLESAKDMFKGCEKLATIVTPSRTGDVEIPLCYKYNDGIKEYSSIPSYLTDSLTLTRTSGRDDEEKTGFILTVLEEESYVYTGKAIIPKYTISYNGIELISGVDYTLKLKNNLNASTPANKATITVIPKGNLSGSATRTFTINQKDISDDDVVIANLTGIGKLPQPAIFYRGQKLSAKDYSVTWDKGVMTIDGKRNFTGNVQPDFTILDAGSKLNKIKAVVTSGQKTYNGAAQPLGDNELKVTDTNGKILNAGTDYQVSYSDNVNAGTVKVVIAGIGENTGTVSKSYKILPYRAGAREVAVTLSGNVVSNGMTYTGRNITLGRNLSVKIGGVSLTEGVDYKVKYKNNKNVSDRAEYTVVFQGNYKGTANVSGTFSIVRLSLENARVCAPNKVFKKSGAYSSAPYVDNDGLLIAKGEYSVKYYSDEACNLEITKNSPMNAPGTVYVKVTGNGKNCIGSATGEFEVSSLDNGTVDLSKAKVTVDKQMYSSDPLTPQVKVECKVNGVLKELTPGTDYTVEYVNNLNKGKATVIVNGTGGYVGSRVSGFVINALKVE